MTGAVPEQAFVLKRARRRTIALHIGRDGSLEVRAPTWVSRGDILAFVNEKASWIASQRHKLAAAPPFEHPVYDDGGYFRFFGQGLSIRIDRDRHIIACDPVTAGCHPDVADNGDRPGSGFAVSLRASLRPENVQSAIRRAVRARLIGYIEARLAYWRSHDAFRELPALQIKVRLMHRRWGSCRRNGTLTFSETLAKYPCACIDAVIVHELCHLRHFNHGPAFYALMTEVLPEWKQADRLLETEARRY